MEPFEAEAIIENIEYLDTLEWERTRLILHSNYSMFSKKSLQLADILSFPWEKRSIGTVEISNEDIERLRNKAKQYGAI